MTLLGGDGGVKNKKNLKENLSVTNTLLDKIFSDNHFCNFYFKDTLSQGKNKNI